jgi:hypothetical protein
MCVCQYCNKNFNKKKNQGSKTCLSCQTTKRRWKSRIKLLEMLGNKCVKCGFSGSPASLQFHHVNPGNKKYTLFSKNLLRKDRYEEARKCVILCANCHLDEHTNKELLKKFGIIP